MKRVMLESVMNEIDCCFIYFNYLVLFIDKVKENIYIK
jgi:hypothetical protein